MRRAALLLGLIVCGCKEPPLLFPVNVHVLTDEGRPFPNLTITIGKMTCKTDKEGNCHVQLNVPEGSHIKIKEETPKGYTKVSKKEIEVMQRIQDIRQPDKQLPIEHTIVLAPNVRSYAILIDAQIPGLAVQTFGALRATTNSTGTAMFVHEGSPGDDLKVLISTADHPALRPINPMTVFKLSPRSDAYVVHQKFVEIKAPPPRRKPRQHIIKLD